jgi:hypothetical protein
MLRLIGFLAMVVIGASGFLALDYNMARQRAVADDQRVPTVEEYLGGLSARIAAATSSQATPGMPTDLAGMLPRAPEGWTLRPMVADDLLPFLPKAGAQADATAIRLINEAGRTEIAETDEVVVQTYVKGDRWVVVQAFGYPDDVFTNPARHQLAYTLRTQGAQFPALPVMTLRGLDITEDMLPAEGIRGRLLMADVGGQIHLRILVPKRMKDADLLDVLETLNVAAMNALVVLKQDGLGEVPVVILAADLRKAALETYQADRAARAAARIALAKADTDAAATLALAASDSTDEAAKPAAAKAECKTSAGGIKRCSVGN